MPRFEAQLPSFLLVSCSAVTADACPSQKDLQSDLLESLGLPQECELFEGRDSASIHSAPTQTRFKHC